MWQWINFHLISDVLRTTSVDAQDDLIEDLRRIAASPFAPAGIDHHRMSIEGKQERCVAWLRHGYVLTYRPHISGPPPHAGKNISVQSFMHESDLLDP